MRAGKHFGVFLSKILLKLEFEWMDTIRVFFQKSVHFFQLSEKGRENLSPSPSSTPVNVTDYAT